MRSRIVSMHLRPYPMSRAPSLAHSLITGFLREAGSFATNDSIYTFPKSQQDLLGDKMWSMLEFSSSKAQHENRLKTRHFCKSEKQEHYFKTYPPKQQKTNKKSQPINNLGGEGRRKHSVVLPNSNNNNKILKSKKSKTSPLNSEDEKTFWQEAIKALKQKVNRKLKNSRCDLVV